MGQIDENEVHAGELDVDWAKVWYDTYSGLTYKELAVRMKELSAEASAADRLKVKKNEELDVIRLKIVPERFAVDEISSINIPGVGRLGLTSDMHCNQVKEKQDSFFQWLRDNGYGDMIKDTVNASSLKSLVKELDEDAKAESGDPATATLDGMLGEDEDGEQSLRKQIGQFLKISPFMRASVTKR